MFSKGISFSLFLFNNPSIFSKIKFKFLYSNSDSSSEGSGFKINFDFIEKNQTNETSIVEQQDYKLLQYCKNSNDTLNKPNGKYFQSWNF